MYNRNMPSAIRVLRWRARRKTGRAGARGWAWAGILAAVLLSLMGGSLGLIGAVTYDRMLEGLPSVEEIETQFDASQGGAYRSTRLYDRTGRILLLEISSPPLPDAAPQHLQQATVAFIDPTFWTNRGYDPAWLLDAVRRGFAGQQAEPPPSITQRLVRTALVPPGEHRLPVWLRVLREAVLAGELTARYPKEQILAWYLNSASAGPAGRGVEAAARRYLGKSAAGLTLGESALLVGVLEDPALNPWDAPQRAKARQAEVLEAMQAEGMIEAEAARAAMAVPLSLQPRQAAQGSSFEAFARLALAQLGEALGPGFADRGGLRLLTTLDYDLQLQADCLARTQVLRLSGASPAAVVAASDGAACVAAGLLPPLRPGDAGVDHHVSAAAVAVLEPSSGEVLSLVAPAGSEPPGAVLGQAGTSLYPIVYLTALASGYSPASMVLDVPTTLVDSDGIPSALESSAGIFRGPVRLRTALVNAYPAPAARILEEIGVAAVTRTARLLGLTTVDNPEQGRSAADLLKEWQVDLLELAYAYGVVANGGVMVGMASENEEAARLSPALVLRVEDGRGLAVYEYRPETRVVLSVQLAYLMAHMLSDETARWESLGRSNVLEVGRPAGAMIGLADGGYDNWAVGFTPNLAVAAWVGSRTDKPMAGIGEVNGAAPVWNAVLRYAARDRPRAGWERPPGISQVEVCDPSGLLPTEHCPKVVREVFVQGTEPTHYDTLYRPFRVNRETGKLATLFTPLDLVEERVYLIPPPEASAWAEQAGIERPPQEYDTVYSPPFDPQVNITAPASFSLVRGVVTMRGSVHPPGLDYYRLQFGQGLNPSRWVQVGEDARRAVEEGRLGQWDTTGLDGLYTLQVMAVLGNGRVVTAAVPVTVDNRPPQVRLVLPSGGKVFRVGAGELVVIQAEVIEEVGIERVELFVDGRAVASLDAPPFSTRWNPESSGEYTVWARAHDLAGNRAESERVTIRVLR